MIALSTAWRPRDHTKLPATLAAAAAMGFQAVEIGVSGARFRLKKAQRALEKAKLKVVSLHNVCSEKKAPLENQRGDWLGSPDPEERRRGVEATRETNGHAEALGASAVVLHVGSPPIERRWEMRELLCRLTAGGMDAAEEYGVTRDDLLAERDELAPRHLEAACQSIAELLEGDSKVKLGVECRVGYHELPSFEELRLLLERFPGPRLGYWHDVGHAVIQQAMGFVGHCEWLSLAGDRTFGVHLHDVVRRKRLIDHYPPGLGFVDFEPVLERLPPDAIRVLELSSSFITEEVLAGKKRLEEVGF